MKNLPLIGAGVAIGVAAAVALSAAHGADPAYGQLELFSAAFSKVRAEYVEPVKDNDLVEGAIEGMVTRLDPHSSYMTAKSYAGEFEITTRGQFGGVGLTVMPEEGMIKVITPTDGMPAAKAGIKTGDKISAIDSKSITGTDFTEAVNKMRGPAGTKV